MYISIVETPIRHQTLDLRYIKARVENVDFAAKTCQCVPAFDHMPEAAQDNFDLPYDYLVLAPGCTNNTFGTPGVAEHAMFVRNARDAKAIQAQIRNCFERASIPALNGDQSRCPMRGRLEAHQADCDRDQSETFCTL